jgi:hypothetical protein
MREVNPGNEALQQRRLVLGQNNSGVMLSRMRVRLYAVHNLTDS